LEGIDLTGASLCNADLREARVNDAKFIDCNLTGADLRDTPMELADTRGAIGIRS
jgi:uncharacterized protein YjbI with pentapeptide repeats